MKNSTQINLSPTACLNINILDCFSTSRQKNKQKKKQKCHVIDPAGSLNTALSQYLVNHSQ